MESRREESPAVVRLVMNCARQQALTLTKPDFRSNLVIADSGKQRHRTTSRRQDEIQFFL